MDNRRLTRNRLILAVVSTSAEEGAVYAAWRWLLPEFDIILPTAAVIAAMIIWGVFSVSLFIFTTKTLKKQIPVGLPSMIGSNGKAASALVPEGMVKIKSELWSATSETGNINKGDNIEVVGEDGLRLIVRRNIGGCPTH